MDILGIGPLELALIAIVILLVLGPKEMVSALRTMGRVMRSIVTSEWWNSTRQAIQDVRKLPYDLMREAGMEEDLQALDEIRQTASGKSSKPPKTSQTPKEPDYSAWTQPATGEAADRADQPGVSADGEEPSILPPSKANPEITANDPEEPASADAEPGARQSE